MARVANQAARERRVSARARDDFFRTPPEATRALLEREVFHGDIWEPACGDGAMAQVMSAAGYNVWSTDLVDRGYGVPGRDFLLERGMLGGSANIVTNPPFSLATEFVQHALGLGARKVAVLCRVAFLEGKARGSGIHNSLSRVWVFSSRITLWHGDIPQAERPDWNRGAMAFAWFVWERHHRGPQVGFIP